MRPEDDPRCPTGATTTGGTEAGRRSRGRDQAIGTAAVRGRDLAARPRPPAGRFSAPDQPAATPRRLLPRPRTDPEAAHRRTSPPLRAVGRPRRVRPGVAD